MDAVCASSGSVNASAAFSEIIKRRQSRLDTRLQKAVDSGEMTAEEQSKLQTGLESLEKDAMADGTVSADEFKQIMQAQNTIGRQVGHKGGKHGGHKAQGPGLAAGQTGQPVASNASQAGDAVWADMNKLFQDIAQLRQDRQSLRIGQGVASGKITDDQAQALEAMESANSKLLSSAMADGSMSREEFSSVMMTQNLANRQMRQYLHNQAATNPPQTSSQEYTPVNATA